MNRKLTLLLDETAINQAREYAKENNTSLSAMVKHYFQSITAKKNNKTPYPPVTAELHGVLRKIRFGSVKSDYTHYLTGKYS